MSLATSRINRSLGLTDITNDSRRIGLKDITNDLSRSAGMKGKGVKEARTPLIAKKRLRSPGAVSFTVMQDCVSDRNKSFVFGEARRSRTPRLEFYVPLPEIQVPAGNLRKMDASHPVANDGELLSLPIGQIELYGPDGLARPGVFARPFAVDLQRPDVLEAPTWIFPDLPDAQFEGPNGLGTPGTLAAKFSAGLIDPGYKTEVNSCSMACDDIPSPMAFSPLRLPSLDLDSDSEDDAAM